MTTNGLSHYKIGGLEPSDKPTTIVLGGTTYVVSDKFKSMLRDNIIDWGTFLEIYHNNLNISTMFNQMVKLLNVKANENLRESIIPIVEKIYNLPAESHMSCMVKQFMMFEPVSIAIHELFNVFKYHYEDVFEKFLTLRNKYITDHSLKNDLNNIKKLYGEWEDAGAHYNSSSIKLLFLNPPDKNKSGLNFNIDGLEDVINPLRDAVKEFHYLGFCPKVPHTRLNALLTFPINEFNDAIKRLDPKTKFPKYSEIEKKIKKYVTKVPKVPVITGVIKRETLPKNITDKIEIAKWYIDKILDIRKTLIKDGTRFEEYYIKHAKVLHNITKIIKEGLGN
jgi:hypothetical protein